MTEVLVLLVLALVVIAGATVVGPRIGIASPLVLVAVGVGASFLPAFANVEIEPEWILAGVLPPLLYSSAVAMPAMNFRREFSTIGGLSVVLVVVTSLVLGVFFMLVLPDLGFAWGVALGAIISPTDAVATSIVKRTSVSKRVVAILDGESLLNDATALVLLRTAIVATAAAFSFWGAVGSFAYSVVIAVVVGGLVGVLNLLVRRRLTDPTVNTVISFTIPFLASVPAELLGASGLVAAVVAGLVTGVRAPRDLSPQARLSDAQNWRTVELVLEGAVFLTMGIQITSILADVEREHAGIAIAVLIAAGALVITVLVRAAYVAPLLAVLHRRSSRADEMQQRVLDLRERIQTAGEGDDPPPEARRGPGPRTRSPRDRERFGRRITQALADIAYFTKSPLGWREGTAVVWAGMRGAVTVAAAQTLPEDTPQRPILVLIAFAVATLSLVLQGATIGPLLKRIAPPVDQEAVAREAEEERTRLYELMRTSSEGIPRPERLTDLASPEARTPELFDEARRFQLQVIAAQRTALLDARDNGTFDADVLASMLTNLDASQIALELRTASPDE